jgi:cytochrome P450
VYANLWALTRDERIYPDPNVFNPQRFLATTTPPQRDPRDIAFGFGLRRCPGMHLADAALWLSVTRLLATFQFLPSLDEIRGEVVPEEAWTSGPNW